MDSPVNPGYCIAYQFLRPVATFRQRVLSRVPLKIVWDPRQDRHSRHDFVPVMSYVPTGQSEVISNRGRYGATQPEPGWLGDTLSRF